MAQFCDKHPCQLDKDGKCPLCSGKGQKTIKALLAGQKKNKDKKK